MLSECPVDDSTFVSCVTVTTGRPQISHAIQSFAAQDYPHRELIIVSQGDGTWLHLVALDCYEQIKDRVHVLMVPKTLNLGQLRNLSIELAHGNVICQWDDDDLYHPERIRSQLRAMKGGVASLYTKYLKLFADTQEMYMIDHLSGTEDYLAVMEKQPFKKYLCGSVMFRKSCFHDWNNRLYPEFGNQTNTEEDLNVLQKLMKSGDVHGVQNGYEYCYVYHGANVYSRQHHEMLFHKKGIVGSADLLSCKDEIDRMLMSSGFDKTVRVLTSKIVDFDHEEKVEKNLVFEIKNLNKEIFVDKDA